MAALAAAGVTELRVNTVMSEGTRNHYEFLHRQSQLLLQTDRPGALTSCAECGSGCRGRRPVSPVWLHGDGIVKSLIGKIEARTPDLQRGRIVSAEGLYHFRSGDFHP